MHSLITTLFASSVVLCSTVVLAVPSPYAAGSRSTSWLNSSSNELSQERADAVKAAFETAWDGYYEYAFPNDELLPVNNSFGNSRCDSANTFDVGLTDHIFA